ncbi:MAG: hypothetical protein AABY64_05915, partial [Bdellovibrionota bacterium]
MEFIIQPDLALQLSKVSTTHVWQCLYSFYYFFTAHRFKAWTSSIIKFPFEDRSVSAWSFVLIQPNLSILLLCLFGEGGMGQCCQVKNIDVARLR